MSNLAHSFILTFNEDVVSIMGSITTKRATRKRVPICLVVKGDEIVGYFFVFDLISTMGKIVPRKSKEAESLPWGVPFFRQLKSRE